MAEMDPSNQINLDRRQLLTSVAAATATGIVSGVDRAGAAKPAEVVELVKPSSPRSIAEEDWEEFKRFKAVHAKAVWGEVLKRVQAATGNPNWRPRSWAEGLMCHQKVNEILRQRFRAVSW